MGKILITGVGGLLGSRLADWVIENTEYEVVGIDDLSGGFSENINRKVKFYKFNLTDLQAIQGVFERENINIVYHFAAYAAEGLSPFIRKYNYENNLIASTNLITCSIQHEISRFVFASSMSVYGDQSGKETYSEEDNLKPKSFYAVGKVASENYLKIYKEQYNIEFTVFRFTRVQKSFISK